MLTTLGIRFALATTGSLLATGILAGSALANGELDQEATFNANQFNYGINADQTAAQIFTAGISGELSAVDLGIKKEGNVTNLRVEITDATSGVGGTPSGSALAFEALTGSELNGIVTSGQHVFTVNFANPAQVSEGSTYAIVLSTTDKVTDDSGGDFTWYYAEPYEDGNAASDRLSSEGWEALNFDLTFATYVTVPNPSNTSGGSSQSVRTITLALSLPAGVQCSSSSLTTSGPWIQLPSAGDCSITPRDGGEDPSLLGWATQEDFPIDIAQRQVNNGWGAYETFNGEGQLTGVFIPAGGYTTVTNDTNLYPVWSE